MTSQLLRYTAFSRDPAGGNPAGVWLGARLPDADEMQRIAARVGYSETAFVAAPGADGQRPTRYFSPEAEVPFCGHATIAAAVALGDREGDGAYVFATAAGDVPVQVSSHAGGRSASLVSVPPRHAPVPPTLLREVLDTLGWRLADDRLRPAELEARAAALQEMRELQMQTGARLVRGGIKLNAATYLVHRRGAGGSELRLERDGVTVRSTRGRLKAVGRNGRD